MAASTTITKRTPPRGSNALGACRVWGLLPIYELLVNVPALAILARRIIWSLVFVAAIMVLQGNRRNWRRASGTPRRDPALLQQPFHRRRLAALHMGRQHRRVLATSLDSASTPGHDLLRFRLPGEVGRLRWPPPSPSPPGCCTRSSFGNVPWVALGLALTFAFYGLIRKKVVIDSCRSFFAGAVYLSAGAALPGPRRCPPHGHLHGRRLEDGPSPGLDGRDIAAAAPGSPTARGRLITVGFLQYIAPTLQFFLGVWVFHETMDLPTLVTFVCIWIALGLYSWGNLAVEEGACETLLEPPAGPAAGHRGAFVLF